jgi:hypothetical protein
LFLADPALRLLRFGSKETFRAFNVTLLSLFGCFVFIFTVGFWSVHISIFLFFAVGLFATVNWFTDSFQRNAEEADSAALTAAKQAAAGTVLASQRQAARQAAEADAADKLARQRLRKQAKKKKAASERKEVVANAPSAGTSAAGKQAAAARPGVGRAKNAKNAKNAKKPSS